MADLKPNIPKTCVWPYRAVILSQKLLTGPVTLAEGHLNHSSDGELKIWCSHDIHDDDDDDDWLMGAGRWRSVMMFYRRGEGGKQRQARHLFSPTVMQCSNVVNFTVLQLAVWWCPLHSASLLIIGKIVMHGIDCSELRHVNWYSGTVEIGKLVHWYIGHWHSGTVDIGQQKWRIS